MASEKVYEPETINENPLPGEEIEYYSVSDGKSGGTHKPASISNEIIENKRIAKELITTSLNTKSRKITGEYGFTKQGAIQVGEYDNGVSGEVKISPDGLVARNKSGITTFALDGDTGDATFAGTIEAGSVIAAAIDGDLISAGTVTADKLSVTNLAAISASLGTVNVGGSGNGTGILNVKDESNNIIVKTDKDGHHYYDTSANELVTIDETGFHGYNTSGTKQVKIGANTGIEIYGTVGQSIIFKNAAGGTAYGYIGYDSGVPEMVLQSNSTAMHVKGANGLTLETFGSYDLNLETGTGSVRINGNVKTAIVPTSKGYNAMYCAEGAEVWFFDFARVIRPKWYEFWKKPEYLVDKLFTETVASISFVIPTTNKNIVQVWGRRKGFESVRMEKKTEKEFKLNNKFWSEKKN